jgi:ubiquinone/menaquinone biosynthesis C-methylase UbiE
MGNILLVSFECDLHSALLLLEHYGTLAPCYNKCYEFDNHVTVNFIKHFIPLSKEDQLVDIGGGTARISLRIHSDLEMTNPVVCVDPSQEMLNEARKGGAITIQATAEDYFASKPKYPLKVVIMNGVVHHFTDKDFVFAKLAEYMPDDGVCFAVFHSSFKDVPLFEALKKAWSNFVAEHDQLHHQISSKGLKCQVVSSIESEEVNKSDWYDAIRMRFVSMLEEFSDEEIEQGIKELEEKFQGQDVLKFDMLLKGLIVTKVV